MNCYLSVKYGLNRFSSLPDITVITAEQLITIAIRPYSSGRPQVCVTYGYQVRTQTLLQLLQLQSDEHNYIVSPIESISRCTDLIFMQPTV